MSSPIEAHKRLMKLLPVRTHTCWDQKTVTGPNRGRAVIFKGVRYESVTAAAKAHDITKQAVFKRISRRDPNCYYERDD